MTVGAVAGPAALSVDAGRVPATAASRAAVSFERVLLEQLTTQLASTAAPEDASPATAAYRDLLPATMADALSQAGGIGLAARVTGADPGAAGAAGPGAGADRAPTTADHDPAGVAADRTAGAAA